MGFQDNSGDIIFDVVLTDEGRKRLSEGDFQITKFKCSDDEINYELFNLLTQSAYQDLQILQTPVFEAFTNNTSNMTSLLVSYDSQDLMYLPIIKLNTLNPTLVPYKTAMHTSGSFMVAVNTDTAGADPLSVAYTGGTTVGVDADGNDVDGFLFGADSGGGMILVDSGLDTNVFTPSSTQSQLPDGMTETGYIIEMDHRLGNLLDENRNAATPEVVDDDNIAIYTLDATSDSNFVVQNHDPQGQSQQVIQGYRFKSLRFKIGTSLHLRQSDYYFNKFGGTTSMATKGGSGTNNVLYIDTLIKVTGIDTGYSLEIPVRYVKLKS
tara:strand:- start:5164 stop:6132 length:969 start_codon:yes stop_codon:yes gene_type:complete